MSKNRVHITPRSNGWAIVREGADRASAVLPTQSQAEQRAKATLGRCGATPAACLAAIDALPCLPESPTLDDVEAHTRAMVPVREACHD